ncbi:TatD family hydrolase [Comamonadaceae bacterium G21597-S1]|nr:TatD family hydrolase [Comamonadaceae bacterium G21597-S1]
MTTWIDTHCHLDAPEFADRMVLVRARARERGVAHCVIPAVCVDHFDAVRALAHGGGDSYALGIHPLFVPQADDGDLQRLAQALQAHRDDPRLVAVGEIGLDFFVPALCEPAMRARQERFYLEQLQLARRFGLPVILHVRRSADRLLRGLRAVVPEAGWTGIAHAFAGSWQQARMFAALGFKLGFGGAVTFERALQLRRLASDLPLHDLVLETDAPDIPPHWLYRTAAERAAGQAQAVNEPGELPAIAAVVAQLRAMAAPELAAATAENACVALPKLRALLV